MMTLAHVIDRGSACARKSRFAVVAPADTKPTIEGARIVGHGRVWANGDTYWYVHPDDVPATLWERATPTTAERRRDAFARRVDLARSAILDLAAALGHVRRTWISDPRPSRATFDAAIRVLEKEGRLAQVAQGLWRPTGSAAVTLEPPADGSWQAAAARGRATLAEWATATLTAAATTNRRCK